MNTLSERAHRDASHHRRLTGRRALITGGSRGIGAAIARRLADDGAAVAINYSHDDTHARTLVDELAASGCEAHAFKADISDPAQIARMLDTVVDTLGGIDLLAANAGVEHFGALEDLTLADFDKIFHINVAGQLFAVQAAVTHMTDGARIVLTSSVSARIAVPHHTLYAASKAAVSAMAHNLAPELAHRGIAINVVAPGPTATAMSTSNITAHTNPALRGLEPSAVLATMNSMARMGKPTEIADVVAFLLSTDASFITGTTVAVDGGWL